MANNSQMSMLELAIKVVEEANGPIAINEIIEKVLELKGVDDPKGDKKTQLYVDITTSSCFVYMGDGNWDLKAHQSLSEYDKDGVDFTDDTIEDDSNVTADDYETEEPKRASSDDEDENIDEEGNGEEAEEYASSNDSYGDGRDGEESDDEDPSEFDQIRDTPDADDFDEGKYGDIMDKYEDLYEDK